MPYSRNTRDRLEAWPVKGTKAKLQKRAKAQKVTLGAYLNKMLEREANK